MNSIEKHLCNFKVYETKIDQTKSTVTVVSFKNLSEISRTSKAKKLERIQNIWTIPIAQLT